jgi:hypothetical protein
LRFFEDELMSAVSSRHLVRQVQAASVRKPLKDMIATHAPELLFRAEQAEKYHFALDNMHHQPLKSKDRPIDMTQAEEIKILQAQTGFIESKRLLALDVEIQITNRYDSLRPKSTFSHSKQLKEVGDAEIRAQVEAELEAKRVAAIQAQGETATRSLVVLHNFQLPLNAFSGNVEKQQEVFTSLLTSIGLHMCLHRTSTAHRIKLKLPPIGGPSDGGGGGNEFGEMDDFMRQSQKLTPPPNALKSGQECVFGVAPIVGITVNHPYVNNNNNVFDVPNNTTTLTIGHSPSTSMSSSSSLVPYSANHHHQRHIESISIIYLWGSGGSLFERIRSGKRISSAVAARWIAGVAACLTTLHSKVVYICVCIYIFQNEIQAKNILFLHKVVYLIS